LVDLDLPCIRKVLAKNDTAGNVPPPEEEELQLIQGPPVYELGAFADGFSVEVLPNLTSAHVGVQVWPRALAMTVLHKDGGYRERFVILIGADHYANIESVMHRLALSYVATPRAVREIGAALQTGLRGRVKRVVLA
jgi:hypothetical protein